MRILRIQSNEIFFKRRKNEKTHSPKEPKPERTDFSYLLQDLIAQKLNPSRVYADSQSVYKSKGYVEPKEIEEDIPKPFEETHGKFIPDKYQKEAIDAFENGKTVIVSAPTGIGKTLIAEYAIKDVLEKGKKIIYTSPLKALSNEKYTEFSKLFGTYDENGNLINTDNVGLMTGDTTINPEAPVLVMTTEVYRNSLLQGTEEEINERYKDYQGVIYDEFHYLGDEERGTVWEEAVMNTPEYMQQMMLSATASNSKDILSWINEINQNIETHLVSVPDSERYVPLKELAVVKDGSGEFILKPTKSDRISLWRFGEKFSDRQRAVFDEMKELLGFKDDKEAINFVLGGWTKDSYSKKPYIRTNELTERLIQRGVDKYKAESISLILSSKYLTIYENDLDASFTNSAKISSVVKMLDENEMTPALFYIFSKRKCNEELDNLAYTGDSLLTYQESKEVEREVEEALNKGVFLGSDFTEAEYRALKKGYAVHHAGRLPSYKSLIEKLARKGLVKVCFATETLIAGINMPFRTTVFTSLEKANDDDEFNLISPQTFKQGAGRAGRRGKDDIGNVVVMPKNDNDYQDYLYLTKTDDTSIKSNYQISYATILSDRVLNDFDSNTLKTLAGYQDSNKLEEIEYQTMAKFNLLKQYGHVRKTQDGTYKRTEKGEIAKNIFGINELFLTELLYEPSYLKDCTKTELTALCAAFADVKDREPSNVIKGEYSYMNEFLYDAFALSKEIDDFELDNLGETKRIKYSTNLVPYVLEYAKAPKIRENALDEWDKVMGKMKSKDLIVHEGDFLRVVNGTLDILKLIAKLSPSAYIRNEARKAIFDLKKAPLTDIFNYELDIKEPEEK